jgi:hypothetical protein
VKCRFRPYAGGWTLRCIEDVIVDAIGRHGDVACRRSIIGLSLGDSQPVREDVGSNLGDPGGIEGPMRRVRSRGYAGAPGAHLEPEGWLDHAVVLHA